MTPEPTNQPMRVLVIDDEIGPRESLRILLKNDYEVTCADSVDKGVELAREIEPDLVILDIRMPGKSGITGLQEIRELDKMVSVVMLTGYGALETAQQALRLGASDYLSKPFDTHEMLDVVKRYTQRTRLERRRARMLDDLQTMNRRLRDDMARREDMIKLGENSAELMHDLRNPLTIVSGYVQLLSQEIENTRSMQGQDSEQAGDYLEVIEQNVKRCCELAQMWQKFRKTKAPEFELTRMAVLLGDLAAGAEPLASTRGVTLSFEDEPPMDATVRASRAQIIRAIHNVIANALQAVEPGKGIVQVFCRTSDDEVTLQVVDNGCGMDEATCRKMFDPYFTTKPEGEGTGLGMVITKKILEEHGGSITVESRPGHGTTITLCLPLVREDAPAATATA